MLALKRDANVFQRGEMRKYRRDLERANQPHARHVGGRHRGDVLPLVQDFSGRRFEELGQKIETRRLAGTVRADQRVNAPTANLERNVADGEEARELLGQAFRFENELIGQTDFPLPRYTRGYPCCFGFPEALKPVPERRLRARNMPEVTGVRQGGKLSRSGLRPGDLCSLSRTCF